MKTSRWIVGCALLVTPVLLYNFMSAATPESDQPQELLAQAGVDGASTRADFNLAAPRADRPGLDSPRRPTAERAPEGRPASERGVSARLAASRDRGGDGDQRTLEDQQEDTSDPRRILNCQLTLLDEAEIPAQEAGVLKELRTAVKGPDGAPVLKDGVYQWDKEVKEGLEVSQGELLGLIDDTQARLGKQVADYKFAAASKEGENDVSVRHAGKLFELSKVELESGLDTNRKAPGAMSTYDLRRMRFKCEEASLQIEQSQHELDVSRLKASVSQAEASAAAYDIDRRRIESPLSGMVVRRYRHTGEWVKPGDTVLHVVRLDRLRIQAFLDSSRLTPAEVDRRQVTVHVNLQGQARAFPGAIVFVSPKIETDRRFLVHAEVVNEKAPTGHWLLLPGQKVEMVIAK